MRKLFSVLMLSLAFAPVLAAEEVQIVEHNRMMDHGDGHLMDMEGGMVMGQNKDKLPGGCDRISEDAQITVRGGHKYAKKFPGTMFAFDTQEWRFKPCTRLTVTFINEDNIRHQWMMHGLPKYLYDKGMFHIEVTGPAKITGTLILPAEDKTYLVHCDIAQHMEKGMKGQLIVGKGSGTFPSIPGLTDPVIPDDYTTGKATASNAAIGAGAKDAGPLPEGTGISPAPSSGETFLSGSLIIGLVLGMFGVPYAIRLLRERFRGMTGGEIVAYGLDLLKGLFKWLGRLLMGLYQRFTQGNRLLPKE